MINLEIDNTSVDTIEKSFDRIAEHIFCNFMLTVNNSLYRIIDIEFYYFCKDKHEDVYCHMNPAQLSHGLWYSHGSGLDITFGDGENHGGILIRAIVKITSEAGMKNYYIDKEIHGPQNVVTEIFSNFKSVLGNEPNHIKFTNICNDFEKSLMIKPKYFIKTSRLKLKAKPEDSDNYHSKKLRYVIFPKLKLQNKTVIANDMMIQYPEMSKEEINKELGSTFLK